MKWECSKGHQWEATPNSILTGRWCPYCGGTKKKTMDEIHHLARSRGGKCLSAEYVDSKTKMLWECGKGHQWEATSASIRSGKWCPDCGGTKKKTIEEMHEIARERNGKCLSDTYINKSTKLVWECEKGHRWEATPNSVRRGTWCPHCAGRARLTIEEMRRLATERGGKCLSNEYLGSQAKLLWECSKGHQWEATPSSVKHRKSWCPKCSKKKDS